MPDGGETHALVASLSQASEKARAAVSGCTSSPVTTWMARLAPIARPLRRCAWASAGAMVATTTSLAMPLSRRRRASSSAISSNGFGESLTPSVTTPEPSGLTWMRTL